MSRRVCEARFFYTMPPPVPLVGRSPEPSKRLLGTACLVDDELRVGACTNEKLPLETEGEGEIVDAVAGRILARDEGGHALVVSVRATAGMERPSTP